MPKRNLGWNTDKFVEGNKRLQDIAENPKIKKIRRVEAYLELATRNRGTQERAKFVRDALDLVKTIK